MDPEITETLEALKSVPAALGAVKFAAGWIAGGGAAIVVHQIIEKNIDVEGRRDAMKVAAASLVLGGMASKTAKHYVSDTVDSTYSNGLKWVTRVRSGWQKAVAEAEAKKTEPSATHPDGETTAL